MSFLNQFDWRPFVGGFALAVAIGLGISLFLLREKALSALKRAVHWLALGLPPMIVLLSLGGAFYRIVTTRPVAGGDSSLVEAAFLLVGGVFCALMLAFLRQLAITTGSPKEAFSIERRWGTLGGSADGYTITSPVAILGAMAACLFALMVLGFEARNTAPSATPGGLKISAGFSATPDGAK